VSSSLPPQTGLAGGSRHRCLRLKKIRKERKRWLNLGMRELFDMRPGRRRRGGGGVGGWMGGVGGGGCAATLVTKRRPAPTPEPQLPFKITVSDRTEQSLMDVCKVTPVHLNS